MTYMKKYLLYLIFLCLAAVSVHAQTFTSTEFRLDNRLSGGVRQVGEVEVIQTSAAWQTSVDAASAVATVTHTPPGGEARTLHTTASAGTESFVWDPSSAVPGDHVFTHVIRSGSTVLDTMTVTFSVPEPTLGSIRVYGPSEVVSGKSAAYQCMGYFSDGTGREVAADWSVVGGCGEIDAQGVFAAGEVETETEARIRAVVAAGGSALTNELAVVVLPPYLNLSTDLVKAAKTVGEYTVGVTCSGAWVAEADEEWITVVTPQGEGDGSLRFTVSKNTKAKSRTGAIYVYSGDLVWELTVKQAVGEEETYVEVSFDPCGGTATQLSRRYLVGSSYGTLPGATRSGMVFGGWWTQPGGKGSRVIVKSTVDASVVRLYAHWTDMTVAAALNGSLDWNEDPAHPWVMDWGNSVDGTVSMRSAPIGDDQESTLWLSVTGPGLISFYWKASSERKVDILEFGSDGRQISKLSGETGWQQYDHEIVDGNVHTLYWTFSKDESDSEGQDCGWLDSVVWMPKPSDVQTVGVGYKVPTAWLAQNGIENTDEDLEADNDGDGMSNYEEYVAGTDPNDPGSSFRLYIDMVDGKPEVRQVPNLGSYRSYELEGKADLTDEQWEPADESKHKFFRAKVNLK